MAFKLFDYQIDAIKRMKNGCILYGGVGSGKSLTSLGYYYIEQGGSWKFLEGGRYIRMKNPRDLYIITTARKRDTKEWQGELSHYLLSPTSEANAYSNKVIIDSWNNIKKYDKVYGAFFIFDEQRLVGSGAWVKAFLKIARRNQWILLTATPGDSWNDYVPVFIANGFFKNRSEFEREHTVFNPHVKFKKIERYIGTGKLNRLRNSILVDMDFKRETTAHHEYILTSYDVQKYKQAGKTRWNPYKNEPIQNAAELCYIWRRITNEDVSRQVALLEIFEDHPKMIVFYRFDYELDILKGMYFGDGVEIAEWNGHKHEPVPTGRSWIYLVQYTAGAEGWNCISTDTMVFYSQDYSYKVMQQAAGRIDRLTTPFKDLYYYHLRSRSPIDLAISRAYSEKRDFNERRWVKW